MKSKVNFYSNILVFFTLLLVALSSYAATPIGGKSNGLENKIIDSQFRNQAFVEPANTYVGLIRAHGIHAVSTSFSLNDIVYIEDDAGRARLYKATTAGTTAGTKPSYPGSIGEVITDGSAQFTEIYEGIESGAELLEPVGGAYSRVAVASSLASWAGTQGAGTTTASTGTGATTSNNASVPFTNPTGDWGWMVGFIVDEASTGFDKFVWATFATPVQILNGTQNISFAAGALTYQEDK